MTRLSSAAALLCLGLAAWPPPAVRAVGGNGVGNGDGNGGANGGGRAQDGAKAAARRTTWDAVYTAEQATRGKALYAGSCTGCHKADLRGDGMAPSLVEEDFAFQWGDASVGELFQRIRTLMPSDRPNSLPAESYRDIVAYILQANAFPSGPLDLSADGDVLNQIAITVKRP